METNTSDIEVRSPREGARVIDSSNDEVILPSNRNEQIPESHSNLSLSRYDTEKLRGSHTRRMSENMRTEQESCWRTAMTHRREYPDESSDNSHSDRRTYDD